MKKIRLLLVDDHKIIRDGLKALLGNVPHIEIIGECEDGDEVIPFLKNNWADIILMDVDMKRLNGIDATTETICEFPDAKIITLSMHQQENYITRMLKAGASGYILKDAGKEEIILAIDTVSNGKHYFSPEVSETIMSKYMKVKEHKKVKGSFASTPDELTGRETEILKLITEGLTTNQISEKLFLSPRTVDTHRRNLLHKIGVNNSAGLVKFAVQFGIS